MNIFKGGYVRSLRGQLVLLVLLLVVPFIGLMVLSYVDQHGRASAQAQGEALRLARLIAGDQRRIIDDARLVLASIAALPEARGTDVAACNRRMVSLKEQLGSFQSLGVIDLSGVIVCSALPEALGVNVGDRTYVQRALATGAFAVGDYQIGRASRTANLNFGYPILSLHDQGAITAIAYGSLNLNVLNRYVAEAQIPSGSAITLFDSTGIVLARYPDADRWIGQRALGAPMVNALLTRLSEATIEAADVDGKRRLIAIVPLNRPNEEVTASLMVGIPADQTYAAIERDFQRNLLILLSVGVVALALAGLGAERLLIYPLSTLVQVTRRIHAGDLAVRSGLKTGANEIRLLANTIDEMADALEAAHARRAEEEALRLRSFELEQQNLAVQESNRLKSEFVSMVSHEMRSPLASVQGYLDLLQDEESGRLNEEQRLFLKIARENTDRLGALINDLLDLARIEAGRLELSPTRVDTEDLVRDVVASMKPMLSAKAQPLRQDLPQGLPPLWVDRARTVQILSNLVSNAHKYSPAGSKIELAARADDATILLEVRDHGVGMTEAELSNLFTPFFRADNPLVRQTSGTGLGLVITRTLVQLHGGDLMVNSRYGQGSTFTLRLPVARNDLAG